MNLVYLGQAVWVRSTTSDNSPLWPAIYLGTDTRKDHYLLALDENDKLVEVKKYTFHGIGPIRKPDKTSPTGFSIFLGELCKHVASPFKIKTPPDDVAFKVLKELRKFIDN